MDETVIEAKSLLDLSKQCLKKVPKQDDAQNIKILILDENELQKIDNIDSYLRIEKLSLCKNQLLRMYGVCRLHNLRELHLAFNGILTIEGLKELTHLTHLNLEGNNIKTIEHLNTNINLEYLNLSENSIGSISDISFLKCLKELYLHGNRITHLRQCDKYLPVSLEQLTLAKNALTDLNEICTLNNLINLYSISIADNTCVQMTGSSIGFDYRPFVLNWCMTVKLIDGFVVNPIESLKAEWLYSQGRGRQFRVGEQIGLSRYLSSVCPLSGEALENENERKLRLILCKAQQHQRQLQEEISENIIISASNSPSSNRKKLPSSRIQSPRFSRLGRQGSPDSMSSSYHGNTSGSSLISNTNDPMVQQLASSLMGNINKNVDNIMIQSLDPTILSNTTTTTTTTPIAPINNKLNSSFYDINVKSITQSNMLTTNQLNDQILSQNRQGSPLVAASKMVPVPESLMSPDCPPVTNTAAVVQHKIISANNTNQQQQQQQHQNYSNLSKSTSGKQVKSNSPKINRTSVKQRQEKSPILNSRKMHNNINSALRTQNNINIINNQNILEQDIHLKIKSIGGHDNSSSNQRVTSPNGDCGGGGDSSIISSDDDSDHINVDKLKTIRNKAAQRCKQQRLEQQNEKQHDGIPPIDNFNKDLENSAILIQKIWRGYSTRKTTDYIAGKLHKKRTQDYIVKLSHDMETTKIALQNERKIQQLQMQAINALWKKVSAIQTATTTTTTITTSSSTLANNNNNYNTNELNGIQNSENNNNSTSAVQNLTKTCSILTNQVEQLQGSMRDILNCMNVFCGKLPHENLKNTIQKSQFEQKDNCSTQTEIVAVHTPQIEQLPTFPFSSNTNNINKLLRPSTLPLDASTEISSSQNKYLNDNDDVDDDDDVNNVIIHDEMIITKLNENKKETIELKSNVDHSDNNNNNNNEEEHNEVEKENIKDIIITKID